MKIKLIILFALLALVLAACSPSTPTAAPTTAPTQVPTQPIEVTVAPTELMVEPTSLPLDPVTLKVGIFPYSAYTPQVIAQEEGFFAEQGITVEFITFQKVPEAIIALVTGQIDITSSLIDISSLNAIAQGANIKYVADEGFIDPQATCAYSTWIVNKDLLASGKLDDLTNLAGMKVALPPAGLSEYAMYLLLKQANLSISDITITDVPAPNRAEAVINGAIDISQAGEPWVTRALATGSIESWQPWLSYMPDQQFGSMWFGQTILDGNQDVGKRFMVAYLKGVRQFNEGKTDRNVEIMAQLTKMEPAEAKQTCWQSFRNDGSLNIQSILDYQKWAVDSGYMDKILTEADIWDPQFIEYANQILP